MPRFDLNSILRGDTNSRSELYQSAFFVGVHQ